KPLSHMLFNTGQYVVTTVLAGLMLVEFGVVPLGLAGPSASGGARWVIAALASAVVLAASNAVLVGTAVAILTGSPFRKVLAEFFGWYAASVVALALLGLVMAELLYVAGVAGTLLIVVPFSIARQTFEVYQRQSAAYRETVRSLVTAIEAKDSYTRGHSERVAWYARLISGRVSLPEHEIQRVEWAALLHDIGKVALDSEMLKKTSSLTVGEYALVREHPSRAVDILSGIDFLEESVPYISAHHERIDGAGYPKGLEGSDIPLGARILAVADSFDAMTSTRAYRDALTYDRACDELRSLAGTQFDEGCVEVFLEVVDAEMVDQLLGTSEWAG
ncbi:MAG: HD-GYP domain-containing protein, partial [Actinomycetota bacterium]|nr:HD-GYP domain-containing protein [Actinomycetota bacterium]